MHEINIELLREEAQRLLQVEIQLLEKRTMNLGGLIWLFSTTNNISIRNLLTASA